MLRRVAPRVAVVGILLVSACTGEEISTSDPTTTPSSPTASTTAPITASSQPHSATVRADVAALYAGEAPSPEEAAESACFADALLERVDPEGLEEAGIVQDGAVVATLPQLDESTAETWVAAQEACADFVEVSTRAVGAQSKGKVDADAYAACLREAITPDEVHAALVNTLSGGFDTPEVAALGEAQAGCVRAASPSD